MGTETQSKTEQKTIIQTLIDENLLEVGSQCCLIARSWYDTWKFYVGFDSDDWQSEYMPKIPSKIDNSHLFYDDGTSTLRNILIYGMDYEILPVSAGKKLLEWYGGGPEIIRNLVKSCFSFHPYEVELHPYESMEFSSNSNMILNDNIDLFKTSSLPTSSPPSSPIFKYVPPNRIPASYSPPSSPSSSFSDLSSSASFSTPYTNSSYSANCTSTTTYQNNYTEKNKGKRKKRDDLANEIAKMKLDFEHHLALQSSKQDDLQNEVQRLKAQLTRYATQLRSAELQINDLQVESEKLKEEAKNSKKEFKELEKEVERVTKENSKVLDSWQEVVSCQICMAKARNVALTPCGHTFCADCVRIIANDYEKRICPICREPTKGIQSIYL